MKLITNKSKNLLYRIQPFNNCTVDFQTSYAVLKQTTADAYSLSFKGQLFKDNNYLVALFSNEPISSVGKFTKTFTTPFTLPDHNTVVFGLNGATNDTVFKCVIQLKPSATYTFTCNFTNITQGSISWKDMMLVEGSTAGDYEPYSYNLLDKWKFEATQTINGVTFTNNGDGTITYNGVTSVGANYSLQSGLKVVAGHKYLSYVGENTNDKISVLLYANEDPYGTFDNRFPNADGGISTALKNSNELYYQPKPLSNISFFGFILKPQLYDLTLMYGAGKEPTTVDQFYTDYPELKVSPLGFIGLKNLEISSKNIKRLKYKTSSDSVDLGIIPSNSGYILDKLNNLSEELLTDTVEKDTVNYHIPDKTNILLNKVEGKTNKIVQLSDKSKYSSTSTTLGVKFTNNGDGTFTINGTNNGTDYSNYPITNESSLTNDWLKGHKYLFYFSDKTDLNYYAVIGGSTSKMEYTEIGNTSTGRNPLWTILSPTDNSIGGNSWYILRVKQNATCTNELASPQVFDLTSMYGFGNEPTTVEQFKKDYPQFFDEKLDGIWNVRTSGISTTGENIYGLEDFIKKNNASDMIITYDGKKCFKISRAFNPIYYFPLGNYSLNFKAYSTYERSFCSFGKYENGTHTIKYYVGGSTYGTWENNHDNLTDCNFIQWYNEVPSDKVLYVDIASFSLSAGIDDTNSYTYTENKIDLLSTQTLNGINGVNDYIEVIDKGNGLYDLKKTQNIDSVDLGTLDWDADGANFSSGSISSVIKPPTNDNSVGNYTCQKYVNVALSKSFVDGDFGVNSSGSIYFRNSAYTTAAAFKTAMNGVILYYQLKTPVITTIATNLTYNQVSAIRTNGGLLLVNDNNNQKYVQPDVMLKANYQYKN